MLKNFYCCLGLCVCIFLGASEKPLARVGILSDTHVKSSISTCATLKKAMILFKKHKVDLIINCGDVADTHKAQAYKNYYDTVRSVYTENKPGELFAFAWHDVINIGNWHTGWTKAWPLFKAGLGIEHEPYSKHYLAGFIFLTAPQNTDWKIYEKMIADACKETPGKPVFLVDHVPAGNTTFNTGTWGSARTRQVLNKYPQIIQLSGHVHGTFRNEAQIWQGEFTQINAGCSSQFWGGNLVGTAPAGNRADEALLMEIYKNKVVIRRFDLARNKEYKKDTPWSFPIPYDRATAPYTAEKRQLLPAPEFASGSRVTVKPEQRPCRQIVVSFPEARTAEDGTFIYTLVLSRKNASGSWEDFSTREMFGGFLKDPEKRTIAFHKISAGYFEAGKEYKVRVMPKNFFGKTGKRIETTFTMPEKAKTQVVFECLDPMKELLFKTGLEGGKVLAVKNGFYQHTAGNARLLFPDHVWKGPAKTKFRFTVDLQMKQPGKMRQWTLVLRNPQPLTNANGRIATPRGDSGVQRYVIEFAKYRDFFNYYLLVREGEKGEIRFNYVKIEKLDQ